jgi:hypothetical protein
MSVSTRCFSAVRGRGGLPKPARMLASIALFVAALYFAKGALVPLRSPCS